MKTETVTLIFALNVFCYSIYTCYFMVAKLQSELALELPLNFRQFEPWLPYQLIITIRIG